MEPEMTVELFIAMCRANGWHFTARWVERRYRELAQLMQKDRA